MSSIGVVGARTSAPMAARVVANEKRSPPMSHPVPPVSPLSLFYSYSSKDGALRDELETHLSLLMRQGVIRGWHDRRVEAGTEWERQIDEHLEAADVILLLVSADFLASDYCYPMFGVKTPGPAALARENALFSSTCASADPPPARKV